MLNRLDIPSRARAGCIHLLISAAVAAVAAGLVFGLWYPGTYRLLAGGQELFILLTTVDVILGPLLTFAVFNRQKGWPHLRRDLAIIGLIQLSALVYGMNAVFEARPIAAVFEVDRFRVITANQVHLPELPQSRPEYQRLPLTGPWLLGTRPTQSTDEKNDVLFLSLEGIDLAQRPAFWRAYEESVADAKARARPFSHLLKQYPDKAEELRSKLKAVNLDEASATFLPLIARGDWVVVLNPAGQLSLFLPLDGFF